MNDPIRILFDEDLGEPLVNALAAILDLQNEAIEVTHFFTLFDSGEKDNVWVPQVVEGGWVVISADKGRCCGGVKLSAVCSEHKVTHILISTGIYALPTFDKLRAILSVWPGILNACRWEKGHRYSLKMDGPQKRFTLTESMTKAAAKDQLKSPRLGFDGKKRRVHREVRKKIENEIPRGEGLFDKVGESTKQHSS